MPKGTGSKREELPQGKSSKELGNSELQLEEKMGALNVHEEKPQNKHFGRDYGCVCLRTSQFGVLTPVATDVWV